MHFFIKNLVYLILLILISSCQTPRYQKVSKVTDPSKFLPEVQFSLSENFNKKDIKCILIGKINDKSKKTKFKNLNKKQLIRHAIYGHLSPKNYRDIELHRINSFLIKKKSFKNILNDLNCDAIIEGEIIRFDSNFFLAFSSTNVGLKLRLKDKDDKVYWEGSHIASSKAGSFPLSPIAIASGLYSASINKREETALQMVDTVVRRIMKTLPNVTNLNNNEQIMFSTFINHEKHNFVNPNFNKPFQLFANGQFDKAINLINQYHNENKFDDKLLFLKGRSYLLLNENEAASQTFLDVLAIKEKSEYFNGLGYSYMKMNKSNKAIAAYNKAINLDNKNSFAYFNAGLLFEKGKLYSEAIRYYYSAGTSSILTKDYQRVFSVKIALKRLAKFDKNANSKIKKIDMFLDQFLFNDEKQYQIKKVRGNY